MLCEFIGHWWKYTLLICFTLGITSGRETASKGDQSNELLTIRIILIPNAIAFAAKSCNLVPGCSPAGLISHRSQLQYAAAFYERNRYQHIAAFRGNMRIVHIGVAGRTSCARESVHPGRQCDENVP